MSIKQTDQKDQARKLAIIFIVLLIFVVLASAIAIAQMDKIEKLETSLTEKGQVIAAALEVIIGLKADAIKLEDDIVAMELQAANDQKEIKALKHSRSEFTTIAAWLIKLEKECPNLCSKFVPGVLKGLKKFEALIDQLAKSGSGKMSTLTAKGNGLIVMIGNKGEIIINRNGDIRRIHPITSRDLVDISYVGNQFIIADEERRLYTSRDGLSWREK